MLVPVLTAALQDAVEKIKVLEENKQSTCECCYDWTDENPTGEDRTGFTVVFENGKIRPSVRQDSPDDVLGVITPTGDVAFTGVQQIQRGQAIGYRWRKLRDVPDTDIEEWLVR